MPTRPTVATASPRHTGRRAAGGVLFLALLTGCGGGGGAPSAPSVAGNAGASTAAGAAATAATDCGLAGLQAELLTRMNQWRATGASCGTAGTYGPTVALVWNSRLQQAGTAHSKDMAALDYFSHTGADGSTPAQRITAAGYAWLSIGENIAAGHASAGVVIDAWMASDGHCANLMNPAFTEVGVACVPGSATDTFRNYWSMELGKPAI